MPQPRQPPQQAARRPQTRACSSRQRRAASAAQRAANAAAAPQRGSGARGCGMAAVAEAPGAAGLPLLLAPVACCAHRRLQDACCAPAHPPPPRPHMQQRQRPWPPAPRHQPPRAPPRRWIPSLLTPCEWGRGGRGPGSAGLRLGEQRAQRQRRRCSVPAHTPADVRAPLSSPPSPQQRQCGACERRAGGDGVPRPGGGPRGRRQRGSGAGGAAGRGMRGLLCSRSSAAEQQHAIQLTRAACIFCTHAPYIQICTPAVEPRPGQP